MIDLNQKVPPGTAPPTHGNMVKAFVSFQYLQSEPLEAVERILCAVADGVEEFAVKDEQEIGAAMTVSRIVDKEQ